jgi:YbbR domain-containing protein
MIGLITQNWKYKVGSVGLASLLWLSVVEETELTTSILVPIQFKNAPKELEMSSDVSDKVHLDLRGPASKLRAAALADTGVLLDLGAIKRPGERTFPVDRAAVNLASGVELDRAIPGQVRLRFENRAAKEVPVTVRIRAQPPGGYEIASQSVEPARLRIVGPESRVSRIESVETDSIDLGDLKDAGEVFAVHAYPADSQVRIEGDGRVRVRIQVKKSGGASN